MTETKLRQVRNVYTTPGANIPVQRSYARGTLDRFVKRHDENGVDEVALEVPRKVEHSCDAQSSPNSTIFQELAASQNSTRSVFARDLRETEPSGAALSSPTAPTEEEQRTR